MLKTIARDSRLAAPRNAVSKIKRDEYCEVARNDRAKRPGSLGVTRQPSLQIVGDVVEDVADIVSG